MSHTKLLPKISASPSTPAYKIPSVVCPTVFSYQQVHNISHPLVSLCFWSVRGSLLTELLQSWVQP